MRLFVDWQCLVIAHELYLGGRRAGMPSLEAEHSPRSIDTVCGHREYVQPVAGRCWTSIFLDAVLGGSVVEGAAVSVGGG